MDHTAYMEIALEEARRAAEAEEVPVGALLVSEEGRVLACDRNRTIERCDPTAHAEILVLRDGARALGNYRLTESVVYVTVEPCLMCVGALVHARVREVVYGAVEPKSGALVSTVRALEMPGLNHRFAVTGGVLEAECRELIQAFFRDRRAPMRGAPLAAESDPL